MKQFRSLFLVTLCAIFCTSCKKNEEVKYIAHRGYNKQVNENGEVTWANVENTYASYLAAAQKPFYGLETDVYVTKDHKWVCSHDPIFKSNGVTVTIYEHTLEELKAIPLDDPSGKKDENANPVQSTICTLEEYLSIGKEYNKVCLIEFKDSIDGGRATKDDYKNSVDIVEQYHSMKGVMFISFNFNDLLTIREFASDAKCQYLISYSTSPSIEEKIKMAIQKNMDGSFATPVLRKKYVKKFHRRKLEVNCWTIDDRSEAERIASYGVDYITSNCLY